MRRTKRVAMNAFFGAALTAVLMMVALFLMVTNSSGAQYQAQYTTHPPRSLDTRGPSGGVVIPPCTGAGKDCMEIPDLEKLPHNTVPEPSSALLVGIGMWALRKRLTSPKKAL